MQLTADDLVLRLGIVVQERLGEPCCRVAPAHGRPAGLPDTPGGNRPRTPAAPVFSGN